MSAAGLATLAAATPAPAQAPGKIAPWAMFPRQATQSSAPAPLLGINSEAGRIDLGMLAPPGARMDFFERVADENVPIGTVTVDPTVQTAFPSASIVRIATWRCDRLERRFVSVATAPDGSQTRAEAETRTPSCRDRLEIVVPRNVRRGAVLPVTVTDRFGLGATSATVCAGRRGSRERCQRVTLPADAPEAVARFRAGADAVWRVRVRHSGGTVTRVLTVGRAERPRGVTGLPTLLVVGDSLVQGVDAFLGDRLQTAYDVERDTRPGTGLVKPSIVDWQKLARQHVSRLAPSVTVLSLGVNDGVPIGGTACCSAAWSAAYAQRARSVMATYSRGGRGRVLWFTLPIPRDERFAEVVRAVNVGIRSAVADRDRVTLVELDRLLTPEDRYRDSMPVEGVSTRVRAPDGIHLSVAGARFVASAVVATLRRFGATG